MIFSLPLSSFILLLASQCLPLADSLAIPTSSEKAGILLTEESAQPTNSNASTVHPSSLKADFVLKANGYVTVQSRRGGVYTLSPDLHSVVDRTQPSVGADRPSPLSTVLSRDGSSLVVSWDNGSTIAYPSGQLENSFPAFSSANEEVELGFEGEHGDVFLLLRKTGYSRQDYRVFRKLRRASPAGSWRMIAEYEIPINIDSNDFTRKWIYGFEYGNSQYLVAADRYRGYNEVRVVRLCGGKGGRAWYEATLTCGAKYSYTAYSHSLLNATFVPAGPLTSNTLATLVIGVRSDDDAPEVRLCSYAVDEIHHKMMGVLKACQQAGSGSNSPSAFPVVWDESSGQCQYASQISECRLRVSVFAFISHGPGMLSYGENIHKEPVLVSNHTPSSIAASWNRFGTLSLFLGQPDGIIKEYYVSGNGNGVHREWSVKGYVARIRTDRVGSTLYALSVHQVTQLLDVARFVLAECSDFTSCHSCAVGGGGARCGWCANQGLCGSASQCQSSTKEGGQWISEPEYCSALVKVAMETEVEPASNASDGSSKSPSQTLTTPQQLRRFVAQLPLSNLNKKFLYATAIFLWAGPNNGQLNTPPLNRGGVWHISELAFRSAQTFAGRKGNKMFVRKLNLTWSEMKYSDLDQPFHSAAAAFLYAKSVGTKLGSQLKEQALFFAHHFAPALSEGLCESVEEEEGGETEEEEELRSGTGSQGRRRRRRKESKDCTSKGFVCSVCEVTGSRACPQYCSAL